MNRIFKFYGPVKWQTSIFSSIVILVLILIPVEIHHAHNHDFDGFTHPDCPVYKFLATYFADHAVTAILLFVISGFTALTVPPITHLRLGVYFNTWAQRGPPAFI
jgi:hypothetical protein